MDELGASSEPWYSEIRAIQDRHFYDPWQKRLSQINEKYGLSGKDALATHGRNVPPPWFNGDIEAIEPGRWVLVVSLNPRVDPQSQEAMHRYRDQEFTPEKYWDHWRRFNTTNWYARFFSPLARVAAYGLGESLEDQESEKSFATNRMLFIELCPYGSLQFKLSRDVVEELTQEDVGFKLAAKVRRILIEQGRPVLVLLNGTATIEDFEFVDRERVSLRRIEYPSVDKPAVGKNQKRLWHKQGYYGAPHGHVPVVGFPFLRSRMTAASNGELRQLGGHIRYFMGLPPPE